MNSKNQISRRNFFRHCSGAALAAAAFPNIIPASALGQEGQVAPSNRITVGCIGVGPQGQGVMGNFLGQKTAQVIAVCDVRVQHAEETRNRINQHYQSQGCAIYGDFRELLDRKDIDAVLIATPDHWHVPVAVAAARAGKDMYLEKPMGLSLAEDKILREAVQKNGRVFQFGTQQRSGDSFRLACELVRNKRIGKLKHINVWAPASSPGGSTKVVPVPEGLDYDMWLGPAPYTPYTENKCHRDSKTWWFNYDYALGFIAGWGVHPLDIAIWGTDSLMAGPLEVAGKAVFPTEGACNTSVAWQVDFKCSDGVTMKYKGTPNGYNEISEMNDLRPWEQRYGRNIGHGTAFEGTDGWVMVDRAGIRTYPGKLVEEKFGPDEVHLIRSYNHAGNLLDCVKSRAKTICPIEEAVQADLLCHLSDIATRLGRKLKFDPKTELFVADEEADKRLALRRMRPPWRLQ